MLLVKVRRWKLISKLGEAVEPQTSLHVVTEPLVSLKVTLYYCPQIGEHSVWVTVCLFAGQCERKFRVENLPLIRAKLFAGI